MDTKLILLTIFVVVIFLQMRKNEPFSNDINEVNKANCLNTTTILNKVNKFEKQSCKEDDSKPNNQVANDRLTCRNFNEKNIINKINERNIIDKINEKNKIGFFLSSKGFLINGLNISLSNLLFTENGPLIEYILTG